jgi:hypothetical protein
VGLLGHHTVKPYPLAKMQFSCIIWIKCVPKSWYLLLVKQQALRTYERR